MPLTPPAWLPPEDMDLWEQAVGVLENQGKPAVYPAVVAVYKNLLKKHGRERQQMLPGFGGKPAPDEGQTLQRINERGAEPGSRSIDDSHNAHLAGSYEYLSDADVQKQLFAEEERLAVLYSQRSTLDARIEEVASRARQCEEELAMRKVPVEKVADAPPGFEPTVKKMKKHPEIDNPYALTWYMKNKGDKPGGKKSSFSFKAVAEYREKVAGADNVARAMQTLTSIEAELEHLGYPLPAPHGDEVNQALVEPWEMAVQEVREGIASLKDLIGQGAIRDD